MKSCEKLRMHFIVGIGPFVIIFTLAVVFYLYIVRRIFEYVIYIVRRIFEYVKLHSHRSIPCEDAIPISNVSRSILEKKKTAQDHRGGKIRMRVLFIAGSFKLNFFQQMMVHFPKNIQVDVIDVNQCFDRHGWCIPSRSVLEKLIHFEPDLVYTDYSHYPTWFAKLYSLLSKRRIPTIVHLRGDWWTEFRAWISTPLSLTDRSFAPHRYYFSFTGLYFADLITPICRWLERRVRENLPDKPTHVVYQGVDPQKFYKEEGMQLQHPNVSIIQNHTILPKTRGLINFRRIIRRMPEVHFYVSEGQSITQTYLPLVKQAFKDLRNVHFISEVSYPSGLRQVLTETDVYVLASGLDCCPTTVLEAALMEKPVVASKVGGVPEIVKEGITGWTIENDDVTGWVEKIRLLLESPRMAREMGKNGRRWVEETFAWPVISNQVVSIMKNPGSSAEVKESK